MQIFVKSLTGKTITLNVGQQDQIEKIKIKTQEKVGTDLNLQSLSYAGKILDNKHSLTEYNIQSESTLHLTVPLLGGSMQPQTSFRELLCLWMLFIVAMGLGSVVTPDATSASIEQDHFEDYNFDSSLLDSDSSVRYWKEIGETDVKGPLTWVACLCTMVCVLQHNKWM
mmetsp:Transcript_15543/g.25896  ORF Transcript_15543/g.25896 Transcript_15543/m.25896 type:complete len:169 (-) Transcript_15543:206-712(-)